MNNSASGELASAEFAFLYGAIVLDGRGKILPLRMYSRDHRNGRKPLRIEAHQT
jgi:hypothetical protein